MTKRTTAVVLAAGLLSSPVHAGRGATVVRDMVCALFDASGALQFGARGISTIAPSGMIHLVCETQVPAPGVFVIWRPTSPFDVCGIEGFVTSTWEERISPAGAAVLECWIGPVH